MNLNPVTLAIPLYFILIGVELLADQFQRSNAYRLNDSLTNISCGTGQQIVGAFLSIFTVGAYELVRSQWSFFTIPSTWLSFIVVFILHDIAYYWAHRKSHEVNLFWNGGHVVHHQSEEYNLSVALRQGWFQIVFTFFFDLPIALMGFDTTQFVLAAGLNTVYQFWIHTEKIDRMGFLEWFMNTPSHHRVHHGRNPKYIDKNHAGVFIVWDRLFGTFQQEEERPVYGITTPTNSWNPVWVQFKGLGQVFQQVAHTPNFMDKMRVLFYKPGWQADTRTYLPIPDVKRDEYQKFNTNVPKTVNWYAFFQYLFTLGGAAVFAFGQKDWTLEVRLIVGFLIIWAVVNIGLLFERSRLCYYLEYLRPLVSTLMITYLVANTPYQLPILYTGIAITILSWLWAWRFRAVFER